MKIKPLWKNKSVLLFLFFIGTFVGYAWAETTEIVTYYPTSGGNEHVTSLTVGNAYLNTTLANGQALIQTSLGIGPGFGNNAPTNPLTLLQVQGVAGQASQALFLPGAGGTISLDIAGDLFVRQAAGSANYVQIRGPSDQNTAIELRSETFGGNPYIDFANDAPTDFDMRIQMTGNDSLAITGGNLSIGTAFPLEPAAQLVAVGPFGQTTNLSIHAESDTANQGARLSLMRERGNFPGGAFRQPVLNNDLLGEVGFFGFTGAGFAPGAQISAQATANWTAASTPAMLIFSTTAAGANASTERMRLTQDGAIQLPGLAADPSVSVNNTGRLYYNSTTDQIMVSQSGGAYVALAGGPRIEFAQGFRSSGGTRPIRIISAPAGTTPFLPLNNVAAPAGSVFNGFGNTLDGIECNADEGWHLVGAWSVVGGSDCDLWPYPNGVVTNDFDSTTTEISFVAIRVVA